MHRLSCAVQQYAWGKVGSESTVAQLAELNGDIAVNAEMAYAEYWFGTHHAGPASVRVAKGNVEADSGSVPLSTWLKLNQDTALGDLPSRPDFVMDNDFCGLPYLAKVLSVAKCLSIQAHPDKALAERLHAERPGVYKDPNHKPEMALALTPFEAMCGFRSISEILHFIDTVPEFRAVLLWQGEVGDGSRAIAELRQAVSATGGSSDVLSVSLQNLFRVYANADPVKVIAQVDALIARVGADAPGFSPESHSQDSLDPSGSRMAEGLAVRLAGQFPGDIGVFAPFLLNFLRLKPGEAIFLAANEPHAYVSGDCFEVMANSNNVVRMGCTPKLRDVPVLTEMLTFSSGLPSVLDGDAVNENVRVYTPTDPSVTEFQLERVSLNSGEACALPPAKTPSIVIIIDGAGTAGGSPVSRGQVYVQQANANLEFAVSESVDSSFLAFRVHCREL